MLSLLQSRHLDLQLFYLGGLFVGWTLILLCSELVLHGLQFEGILTVLELDALIQFVLGSFCFFFVLLLQLNVLLLIDFSLNEFVPAVGIDFILEIVPLFSTLLDEGWLGYLWFITIQSVIRRLTDVSLVIALRHFPTFIVPIHVEFVSPIIHWKLELRFSLSIVRLLVAEPVVCWWHILDILIVKLRDMNLLHCFWECWTLAYNRLIYFIHLNLTERLLVQAPSQCHDHPFAFWAYEFVVKQLDDTSSVFGSLFGEQADLEFEGLFLEFFSEGDFLIEDEPVGAVGRDFCGQGEGVIL